MNVSDLLVKTLEEAGIKRLYAITGDSLNAVNDAIRRNGAVEWVHVRHEETGAFAAAAEAMLTGKLACCAGSSGPGHIHLVNGLYEAMRSYAPVLAIASTMASNEFGRQYFQSTDPMRLFADCSHYCQVAANASQFSHMLKGAMQTAVSQAGVGVLALPGDIAQQAIQEAVAPKIEQASTTLQPSMSDIKALADLLNSSKSVALFCGMGCADAHEEVAALSGKLNAAVTTTARGKMKNAYDMPGYVGLNGFCGNQAGFRSQWEAEVLVLLGCDFPYDGCLPKGHLVAQIDIRASHLGRRVPLAIGINSDVKSALQMLLPLIEQKSDHAFLDTINQQYAIDKQEHRQRAMTPGVENKIKPQYVMDAVNRLANDDAVFTVDTGDNVVWASQYLDANGKREMIGSYSHGSMANAMPMAIGAANALPGHQVIALCGDGGISMLLGDLATIKQYNLPIKLVVFDNRALGFVKLEMQMDGLTDWQTNLVNPDFAQVAKAMGFDGYDVTDPAQLEPTLKEAFAAPGPALISISTDSDEVPDWPNFAKP